MSTVITVIPGNGIGPFRLQFERCCVNATKLIFFAGIQYFAGQSRY